jgi:acetylcholinesterase
LLAIFLSTIASMRSSILNILFVCTLPFVLGSSPIVHSRAGIFHGRHLPEFEQDLYLGIKYAPKPIRFSPSVLAKDAPTKNYNATQYGTDCTGYGSDTDLLVKQGWTKLGEDCLHLNIVKPRINETDLPVMLWIFGGGWQQGATSDPRQVLGSHTNITY